VQAVFLYDLPRRVITRRNRSLDADPVGLLQDGLIGPVRLFRVARSNGGISEGIDQNGQ
jgi:hypothetical protein